MFKKRIIIAPAMSEPNKFFLFKENGLEYTIYILDNRIYCDSYLSQSEKNHIKKYWLKNKNGLTTDQQILKMHESGKSYNYISDILGVSTSYAWKIIQENDVEKSVNSVENTYRKTA